MTLRRLALPLAVAAALASAAPASAATRTFTATGQERGAYVFQLADLSAAQVSGARIVGAGRTRRLPLRQVRAAARRGRLRVRAPRATISRRRKPRLVVTTTEPAPTTTEPAPTTTEPAPTTTEPVPTTTITGRLGGFESGNLSEFDIAGQNGGTVAASRDRAYEGTWSGKATYDGSQIPNAFQRVAYDVGWTAGSDVWYGAAFYIPNFEDFCWWNPMRWDNYPTYGSSGDTGGLQIGGDHKLALARSTFDTHDERVLVGGITIPEARWFYVEVHQRLSTTDGQALSEVYVDGVRVGSSTLANSAGRNVDRVHFGVVSIAPQCSRPGSIYMDRISVSDGPRGPLA